jgi:hypothetical protein
MRGDREHHGYSGGQPAEFLSGERAVLEAGVVAGRGHRLSISSRTPAASQLARRPCRADPAARRVLAATTGPPSRSIPPENVSTGAFPLPQSDSNRHCADFKIALLTFPQLTASLGFLRLLLVHVVKPLHGSDFGLRAIEVLLSRLRASCGLAADWLRTGIGLHRVHAPPARRRATSN